MKKIYSAITLFIALALSLGTAYAQDSLMQYPVYLEFADRTVSAASLDWSDNTAVTEFLKNNVAGIPDGYTFRNYRTNTDIMGFTHHDCRQVNSIVGVELKNRELIVHTDASGKVIFITGDLWTQAPQAKALPAKAKFQTGTQQELVILIKNGKEHVCSVGLKNRKRTYTDVETGETVLSESLFSYFDKATENQKATLTGNAYYEDSKYMKNAEMIGALVNGKYVLQDPVRKVYTINYTNHIIAKNSAGLGEETLSPDAWMDILAKGMPDDALKYGDNFTSSSTDLNIEHNALTSRLTKFIINNVETIKDENSQSLAGVFKCEIRKCNDEYLQLDDEYNLVVVGYGTAWDKGTTYATSEATISDSKLTFNFENAEFTLPSQERDADFEKTYHQIYIAGFWYNDVLIGKTFIPSSFQDDSKNMTLTYGGKDYTLPANIQHDFVKVQPAIDIHWGLERTLDMYKDCFGINSYDNNGAPLVAMVNPSTEYMSSMPFNAAAAQCQNPNFGAMIFGMGATDKKGDMRMYPFVNLFTIGHEVTHLVATKFAGGGEHQVLNESYADIMGKKLERYALEPHYYMSGDNEVNTVSWTVGRMVTFAMPQTGGRCFDDPYSFSHPKYYKGKYWDSETMEEHCNAGVQNHWFYLLCTGGNIKPEQGESVNITAIPRDSAELIAFSALMYFATPLVEYPTARKNSICAAKLYFGENSKEVESVYKAWYACGVGTDEWTPGDPTGIDAVYSNRSQNNPASPHKVLKNGQIIIQKNGKKYNAVGQEL